jgi:hypothetical protein
VVPFPVGGKRFITSSKASRLVLGPTQPVLAWVPGASNVRVKRLGREADRFPQLVSELRISGVASPPPNIVIACKKKKNISPALCCGMLTPLSLIAKGCNVQCRHSLNLECPLTLCTYV